MRGEKKRRLILKRKRWEKMSERENEGRKRRKGREGGVPFHIIFIEMFDSLSVS